VDWIFKKKFIGELSMHKSVLWSGGKDRRSCIVSPSRGSCLFLYADRLGLINLLNVTKLEIMFMDMCSVARLIGSGWGRSLMYPVLIP